MTPSEKKIVKSLVAVAWADGSYEAVEEGVIEGLLTGFGASDEDEAEIREYAGQKRTFDDIPLSELGKEERELLLANAALLSHVDGEQSASEAALIEKLVELLGFDREEANKILESVQDGALRLSSRLLEEIR